jgi:amino acid adenylation domain-containing protein
MTNATPKMTTKEAFVFPASFSQERLWLVDQLNPGDPTYNMPVAVRFHGKLNVAGIHSSLKAIVARHEVLRTTFALAAGELVQVISPVAEIELEVQKVGISAPETAEAVLVSQVLMIAQHRFNLAQGMLLRAVLVTIAPEDHLLVLVLHHIVSDGWSLMVLVREFVEFYKSYVEGRPASLPALPVQYADYAQWQKQSVASRKFQAELSYWKNKLADVPVVDIPSDFHRPAVQRHQGVRQCLEISPAVSSGLIALSKREQTTLFIVLLAAFKVLLHRYSGSHEIVVGIPVAGRKRPELEQLIGCFLNTLVLRTVVPENATFIQLLHEVRDVALDAYCHEDVSFEKVLEEVNPARSLSHTPLFQVFVNMLMLPVPSAIHLPGLAAEIVELPEVNSKFDLTLYIHENEGKISFSLVYNTDLFRPERIAELLRQFEFLLAQIAERPNEHVGHYSLVTSAARTILPDPGMPLDAKWEGAVHELFRAQEERNPHQVAVSDPYLMWSYLQLENLSNQLANYLIDKGIQRGDVVAIYGHRSAPLVLALLGIMKAGAAFLVLDPAYPAARLVDYLDIARPRGLVTLKAAGALPQQLEDLVRLGSYVRFTLPGSNTEDFSHALEEIPSTAPAIAITADDVAYISFTSGSTGKPKGVLGRHGPLSHFVPWLVETFGLNADDRYSLFSALAHDPLHRDVFTPLMTGASVFIPHPDEWKVAEKAIEWMVENNISICHLTPAIGQLLTEEKAERCLNSLRYIFFVGDALTRQDVSRIQKLAPKATCINYFGSTETQRAVSYCRIPPQAAGTDFLKVTRPVKDIVPLGHGIKDVQLLVLNQARQLAGIGEAGEIHLRSPHLAVGYLGDSNLTSEKFLRNWFAAGSDDRLYKTGDLGRYLPDGGVETLGRADTQVKIRGFRIELAEIESVLKRHPVITAAAVIPVNKQLVGYVVLNQELTGWQHELFKHISERLPDYMVPAAFVALPALPLTNNGKLDRRSLPIPDLSPAEQPTRTVQPRNPEEELLCGIFAEVLKRPVGTDQNFFETGGHSLLATQVITRARKAFGVDLPLRALFESPSISGLAQHIREARSAQHGADLVIERASREQDLPLSYPQQRLWFMQQLEPASAAYNMPFGLRLTGKLDREVLRSSLEYLVQRHEVLRTSFPLVNGSPVQKILERPDLQLMYSDLRTVPLAQREMLARQEAREEANTPFDLSSGPLLRVKLLQLSDEEHVLLLTMHHIISDAWSLGIMAGEFCKAHESQLKGEQPNLPDLAVQYADFAVWQRRWLQGEALTRQLEYWRKQLAGMPDLVLPADVLLLHERRAEGQSFAADAELTGKLKALSQDENVTLFMTLLAAYQLTLSRYTGQDHIVVGTDIANRNRLETEGLIGFFVNQLVVRTDLSGNPTFREILKRVRRTVLDAYAHQDAPFDKVVEDLQPDRTLGQTPLFQVKFVLQNTPYSEFALSGLSIRPFDVQETPHKFHILLNLAESDDALFGWNRHNPELFSRETMHSLLQFYRAILSAVSEEAGNLELPKDKLLSRAEQWVLAAAKQSVVPPVSLKERRQGQSLSIA